MYFWNRKNVDAIVIGTGAGLSTSAGLTYSGKRFEDYFADFIQKYGMEDMYSAGFKFNMKDYKSICRRTLQSIKK